MSDLKLIYLLIIIINLFFYLNLNRISGILNIYDLPDAKRKVHSNKVSLLGGSIFFLNILIYLLFINIYFNDFLKFNILYLITILSSIFLIGLVDDIKDIGPIQKFFLFLILFSIYIYFENDLIIENLRFSFLNINFSLGNFSFIFTVLCFILFVNAFNMFDGINGQSAIYIISIFSYFLIKNQFVSLAIIILICSLFFLFFNLNSKIFLGDSGTLLISFLISALIIKHYNSNSDFYCEQIFILMMIPGFDLIRLFFIRIIKKQNPMKADSNHLHHILLKKYSATQTLIINSTLIIIPIIFSFYLGNYILIIVLTLIAYIFLIFSNKIFRY